MAPKNERASSAHERPTPMNTTGTKKPLPLTSQRLGRASADAARSLASASSCRSPESARLRGPHASRRRQERGDDTRRSREAGSCRGHEALYAQATIEIADPDRLTVELAPTSSEKCHRGKNREGGCHYRSIGNGPRPSYALTERASYPVACEPRRQSSGFGIDVFRTCSCSR
jgi:hypothetical protein